MEGSGAGWAVGAILSCPSGSVLVKGTASHHDSLELAFVDSVEPHLFFGVRALQPGFS
jgi:hypothetical protein